MKTIVPVTLALLMSVALASPVLAEQRGGTNSGGNRPSTPGQLSDQQCPQRPCGW
jgi:hypothetical protein